MRHAASLLARVLLIFLLLTGCSGSGRFEIGSGNRFIAYGHKDKDRDLYYVVKMRSRRTADSGWASCTGTVIKATANYLYVMTAAHCVGDKRVVPFKRDANIEVIVFKKGENAGTTLSVDKIKVPMNGAGRALTDLALARAVIPQGTTFNFPYTPVPVPGAMPVPVGDNRREDLLSKHSDGYYRFRVYVAGYGSTESNPASAPGPEVAGGTMLLDWEERKTRPEDPSFSMYHDWADGTALVARTLPRQVYDNRIFTKNGGYDHYIFEDEKDPKKDYPDETMFAFNTAAVCSGDSGGPLMHYKLTQQKGIDTESTQLLGVVLGRQLAQIMCVKAPQGVQMKDYFKDAVLFTEDSSARILMTSQPANWYADMKKLCTDFGQGYSVPSAKALLAWMDKGVMPAEMKYYDISRGADGKLVKTDKGKVPKGVYYWILTDLTLRAKRVALARVFYETDAGDPNAQMKTGLWEFPNDKDENNKFTKRPLFYWDLLHSRCSMSAVRVFSTFPRELVEKVLAPNVIENGWGDGAVINMPLSSHPLPKATKTASLGLGASGAAVVDLNAEESPTPEPEETPEPSESPTPEPEVTPEPSESPTPEPEVTPEPTESPTPAPTVTPEPTITPEPSPATSACIDDFIVEDVRAGHLCTSSIGEPGNDIVDLGVAALTFEQYLALTESSSSSYTSGEWSLCQCFCEGNPEASTFLGPFFSGTEQPAGFCADKPCIAGCQMRGYRWME